MGASPIGDSVLAKFPAQRQAAEYAVDNVDGYAAVDQISPRLDRSCDALHRDPALHLFGGLRVAPARRC